MKQLLTRAFLTLAVAAIGLPFISPAPAHSASLTTLFASNNGGADGGAVYFDLITMGNALTITGFETNVTGTGVTFGFEVYTTPGGSVGNQTNMGVWTSVATGTGTTMPEDTPSPIGLDNTFQLAANTTYGIAIVLDGTAQHEYTNGNVGNQNYNNGDLSLALGSATNSPFTGSIFNPRVWNGTIFYEVGDTSNPVPEPSTMILLGTGLAGIIAWRRKTAA